MKKEVTVCDICSERLAHHKCKFCDTDLCHECSYTYLLSIGSDFLKMSFQKGYDDKSKETYCRKCKLDIEGILESASKAYNSAYSSIDKDKKYKSKMSTNIHKIAKDVIDKLNNIAKASKL